MAQPGNDPMPEAAIAEVQEGKPEGEEEDEEEVCDFARHGGEKLPWSK